MELPDPLSGPVALGCPLCADALTADDPHLFCAECHVVFPVLAGVPILVDDPGDYLGRHRDAVVAALAENGRWGARAARVLREFAAPVPAGAREPFASDRTEGESRGDAAVFEPPADEAFAGLPALLDAARQTSPLSALGDLPETEGLVEVGPGGGRLTAQWTTKRDGLAVDLDLRAALGAARHGAHVAVADAERLPLAEASADLILAENVVDVLARPAALIDGSFAALKPGGELWVSAPDPGLGEDATDAEILPGLAEAVGFEVAARIDHVPWVREHGPRHLEVYSVQALKLRKPE